MQIGDSGLFCLEAGANSTLQCVIKITTTKPSLKGVLNRSEIFTPGLNWLGCGHFYVKHEGWANKMDKAQEIWKQFFTKVRRGLFLQTIKKLYE